MTDKEELSYAESARVGQATNIAFNIAIKNLSEGDTLPSTDRIHRLVFDYVLPRIESVRSEYVKRKKAMLEAMADEIKLDL